MDTRFVDITVEFLAVVFHNILRYASVYPESVFETRRKYSVVVYRCMHPEVNEYMDMCLRTIAEALKADQLYRVEFAVTDKSYEPGLKFVVDFDRMATFDETADAYLVGCEQHLREFCLQLASASHKFNAFPTDSSFEIYLYTNESMQIALANMPNLVDFPIVEIEDLIDLDNVMPLSRFSIRNYRIETYIEVPKPWTFCS